MAAALLAEVSQVSPLRAGELATLIGIPDLWCGRAERQRDRIQHKGYCERIIQGPTDHIATEPIENSHQIQPAMPQTDIRDVAPPNMIGRLGGHAAQQVGIDAMRLDTAAQVGTGYNPSNAHLTHIALDPLAVDRAEVLRQQHRQLAVAVKRMSRVDLCD